MEETAKNLQGDITSFRGERRAIGVPPRLMQRPAVVSQFDVRSRHAGFSHAEKSLLSERASAPEVLPAAVETAWGAGRTARLKPDYS